MIPDKDLFILDAMTRDGGSFVKQLSLLCRLADPQNYNKLRFTFRNYFEDYTERGRELEKEFDSNTGNN